MLRDAIRRSPTLTLAATLASRRPPRDVQRLREEYGRCWSGYEQLLEATDDVGSWLRGKGIDDLPSAVEVDGRLQIGSVPFVLVCADVIERALTEHFPSARTVVQYGSGMGRDLLALELRRPDLELSGYELTSEGVRLARRAAEKFGSRARFAAGDFTTMTPLDPPSDVGFTSYSLVDAPRDASDVVRRIAQGSRLGAIFLEPVAEGFPWSYRGVLGRVYSRKNGYLLRLEEHLAGVGLETLKVPIATSNNALQWPTLYVARWRDLNLRRPSPRRSTK